MPVLLLLDLFLQTILVWRTLMLCKQSNKLSGLKLSLQEKLWNSQATRRRDLRPCGGLEFSGWTCDLRRVTRLLQGENYCCYDRHWKTLCSTDYATRDESAHISRGNRMKVLKLTLRAINGDIMTWMTFWDSYESAIHNNADLSNIDKFKYLKSLLERTVHETMPGLTLTSAN